MFLYITLKVVRTAVKLVLYITVKVVRTAVKLVLYITVKVVRTAVKLVLYITVKVVRTAVKLVLYITVKVVRTAVKLVLYITVKVVRTAVKLVLIYNCESGQNKSKACSNIYENRQCNPLFVTMDTSCKLYFKGDNILQLRTSNIQNRCLRRILQICWPNTITNEELHRRAEIEPISTQVKRRRWRWIGHVLLQQTTALTRIAIRWTPDGQRKRGRPKETWRRTVEREMKEKGWTWGSLERVSADRHRWRALVEALCAT